MRHMFRTRTHQWQCVKYKHGLVTFVVARLSNHIIMLRLVPHIARTQAKILYTYSVYLCRTRTHIHTCYVLYLSEVRYTAKLALTHTNTREIIEYEIFVVSHKICIHHDRAGVSQGPLLGSSKWMPCWVWQIRKIRTIVGGIVKRFHGFCRNSRMWSWIWTFICITTKVISTGFLSDYYFVCLCVCVCRLSESVSQS